MCRIHRWMGLLENFISRRHTSCLSGVKNIGLDIMTLFTKGTELTIFGQLNSNEVLNKFKSKKFKGF